MEIIKKTSICQIIYNNRYINSLEIDHLENPLGKKKKKNKEQNSLMAIDKVSYISVNLILEFQINKDVYFNIKKKERKTAMTRYWFKKCPITSAVIGFDLNP